MTLLTLTVLVTQLHTGLSAISDIYCLIIEYSIFFSLFVNNWLQPGLWVQKRLMRIPCQVAVCEAHSVADSCRLLPTPIYHLKTITFNIPLEIGHTRQCWLINHFMLISHFCFGFGWALTEQTKFSRLWWRESHKKDFTMHFYFWE